MNVLQIHLSNANRLNHNGSHPLMLRIFRNAGAKVHIFHEEWSMKNEEFYNHSRI
jgi:hypothetical protein